MFSMPLMSMPFSQVTFALERKANFLRLAGLIQKRVQGRQYAVSDCEVDEEARSVQCRWKRSVGYKSVQSWIGQALGDSDAEFALRCILETDVGKGDQAHPERPRQPSLALPAPSLGHLAEVDAADALAAHAKAAASPAPSLARPAEFEAAVAPAAPAKAEATSAAYEVQSGPVSKRLCLPAPASASGARILSHAWLPVKAFELDRGADIDPKAKSKFVKLTDISSGTFGITERAIDETTNRVVVLKRLRTQPADKKGKENDTRDSSWEFHHEVFLLTQLRHENIVQLLDVFVHPYTLVLADAGTDLQEHVKQFGSLEEWPAAFVARQVAAGIGHMHAMMVIHCDLKPSNAAIDSRGRVQVLDLGCSVVALPGYRSCRPRSDIIKYGLPYCSIYYRAPEILLGDAAFNFPADCWAAGCLWAWVLDGKHTFAGDSMVGMVFEILSRLGSPIGEDLQYFAALPLWLIQSPTFSPQPLSCCLVKPVSHWSAAVLSGLWRLAPSKRLDMRTVTEAFLEFPWGGAAAVAAQGSASLALDSLDSGFASSVAAVAPTEAANPPSSEPPAVRRRLRLRLPSGTASAVPSADASPTGAPQAAVPLAALAAAPAPPAPAAGPAEPLFLDLATISDGSTSFSGGRGPFSILTGNIGPDVLQYLRDGVREESDWTWTPDEEAQKDRKGEAGSKLEIAYHLRPSKKKAKNGLRLNGRQAHNPGFSQWRAFVAAFKLKNAENLDFLQTLIRDKLEAVSEPGANGRAFQTDSIGEWAFSLGAMQVLSRGARQDPPHWDGGCSYFHMGICLWGRRELILETVQPQVDGQPAQAAESVRLQCAPGHLYAGNLTAPYHSVVHAAPVEGEEALHTTVLGPVNVVLLCRSRCYRNSYGCTGAKGPNPHMTAQAVAEAQRVALNDRRWLLPSLEDCQLAELETDLDLVG